MRRLSSIALVVFLASGCASTGRTLPVGPTVPFPDYQVSFDRAMDQCRRVRTMQLAMGITAQAGETRLRGNLLGAVARPASLRLVGVAPLGAPGFVLVADPDSAVLVLPRDRRVVTGASADDLLAALAGVALGAEDFRAVLTGCIVPDPDPLGARLHENGWIAVSMDADTTAYLETVDGVPVVVAGHRPGLTVWYSAHVRGLPRRIHIEAIDTTGVLTVLTATLSQVSINVELSPDVFVAQVRDDYLPMTLDQLRGTAGPLEAGSDRPTRPQ